MNDDITLNPENTDRGMQDLQQQELVREAPIDEKVEQKVQTQAAYGIQCPNCGTVNEPEARFCASCGKPIGMITCPYCGAMVEPDADFCEMCHHYIKTDVCSFCGGYLKGDEAFCPECGSPRSGITCPVCQTQNDFAFCKQCGTPLTDEARELMSRLRETPEYKEMQKLATEIQKLEMVIPCSSERDLHREQKNSRLRERVLKLLAQDKGEINPVIPVSKNARLSQDEYDAKLQEKLSLLTALLEKAAQAPQPKPVQVRNYAMACKPQGVRLGWECNFKHALHSSPCGCAKPQLGGKWIILGNTKKEIKDDI